MLPIQFHPVWNVTTDTAATSEHLQIFDNRLIMTYCDFFIFCNEMTIIFINLSL